MKRTLLPTVFSIAVLLSAGNYGALSQSSPPPRKSAAVRKTVPKSITRTKKVVPAAKKTTTSAVTTPAKPVAAKVTVRVRRDGTTQDIPVIVGRRSTPVASPRVRQLMIDPRVMVQPGFEFSFETGDDSATIVRSPRAPRPPRTTEPAVMPHLLSGSGSAFAGAELTASNEALGEYFGTSRGIIVLHVAEGTPARQAGILVGDVIMRINDEPVSRPADFQRALARSNTRSVEIQVLRRKKEKKELVLKW